MSRSTDRREYIHIISYTSLSLTHSHTHTTNILFIHSYIHTYIHSPINMNNKTLVTTYQIMHKHQLTVTLNRTPSSSNQSPPLHNYYLLKKKQNTTKQNNISISQLTSHQQTLNLHIQWYTYTYMHTCIHFINTISDRAQSLIIEGKLSSPNYVSLTELQTDLHNNNNNNNNIHHVQNIITHKATLLTTPITSHHITSTIDKQTLTAIPI